MTQQRTTFFAPHLAIKDVRAAVTFYQKAFGANVLRTWNNEDGSIHVAEMEIAGALFHVHEETPGSKQLSPDTLKATTLVIGLFTPNPDEFMKLASDAGAHISNPIQDYEYGYRQGTQ